MGVAERFPDESVRKNIDLDLKLLDYYDQLLPRLEHEISLIAKTHDADSYFRVRSIPGIGRILGLVMLYEIHDIGRFERVQDFVSYCRLVKSARESGGKRLEEATGLNHTFDEDGIRVLHCFSVAGNRADRPLCCRRCAEVCYHSALQAREYR